ncbi:MAG: TIGR02452 family protein [Eubacteriales bacterium]|nr:TIGR02452 family protein [Eubacteriales bacterium]
MFDRREKNVEVFEDTENWLKENDKLRQAVEKSIQNQKLYLQNEAYEFQFENKREKAAQIVISKKRSFEAASIYARQGKKVCVLNFASSVNPGGGVKHGSSAQEECLCRCSSLYPCLNASYMWEHFYKPHRALHNALYNDDCIYTPDVYVIKTDESVPKRMEEKDWYKVDVLTCAAPNLRENPSNLYNPDSGESVRGINKEALSALLDARITRMFEVAIANGAQVIILGAFGCGAFCNPPELVAEVFYKVTNLYQNYFDTIEYAVFCRGYETENYDAFYKEFCVNR